MNAKTFEQELVIKEHHLDTYGHVNNAVYMQILEQARWDLITENGYGIDVVSRTRRGPVILEATLKFRREIKNRQQVRIRSWLSDYTKSVGVMQQTVVNDSGEVCCEASFTFGLFDLDQRKLIAPTAEWLRALGAQPA